jgi:hypothetical protein
MTILLVACGFFLVSFALGFGLGWWVRGAYPPWVPANVTIEEQEGSVAVIPGQLAILGNAVRGSAEPVLIRSFDEYVQHFGQPGEGDLGPRALRFFEEGDERLYATGPGIGTPDHVGEATHKEGSDEKDEGQG